MKISQAFIIHFFSTQRATLCNLLFLGLLLGCGFWLRTIGNEVIYNSDEHHITESAKKIVVSGSIDPHFYAWPGHAEIYMNAGVFFTIDALKENGVLDQSVRVSYRQISRYIIALFGTLMIVIAYGVGSKFSKEIGWYFAFLVTFFAPFIHHSHLSKTDISLAFFVLLTIWLLQLGQRKTVYYILAAIAASFATATKYPGILCVAFIYLIIGLDKLPLQKQHWQNSFMSLIRWYLIISLTFMITTFIVSPYLFLRWNKVAETLLWESRNSHLGADGYGFIGNFFFYLQHYSASAGIILSLLTIIGFFVLLRTQKKQAAPAALGVLYLLVLSSLGLHWERWAMPMYVSLLFFAAVGISRMKEWVSVRLPNSYYRHVLIVLCLIFALWQSATRAIATGVTYSFTETRNAAERFLEKNNISKENSLWEGYTPFQKSGRKDTFMKIENIPSTKQFIILSSTMYGRFLAEPERYKKENAWYTYIFSLPLLAEFSEGCTNPSGTNISLITAFLHNDPHCFRGPTIRIYELK